MDKYGAILTSETASKENWMELLERLPPAMQRLL